MRRRGTLVLLAVAAALAVWYGAVERPGGRDADRAGGGRAALARGALTDVRAVLVERADAVLRFRRDGAGWRMLDPIADRADRGAVNTLADALCTARAVRVLDAPGPPSDYGLDPPVARVTLVGAAAETLACVEVGGETVDRAYAYARRCGADAVLLVPTVVRRAALRPVERFRDPRIVRFRVEDVVAYELAPARGAPLRWERDGSGWMSPPAGGRARPVPGHATRVEAPLRRLRGLRAAAFPAAFPGPAHPRGALRVFLRGGDTVVVEIAGPVDGGALVRWGGRTALVDSAAADLPGTSLDALRDRRVARFAVGDAARVSVRARDGAPGGPLSFTLVRSGDGWAYPNPALAAPPPGAVRRFLRDVAGFELDRVVAEPGTSAGGTDWSRAALEVTIEDTAGRVVARLRAAPGAAGRAVWLVTGGSDAPTGEVDGRRVEALLASARRVSPGGAAPR